MTASLGGARAGVGEIDACDIHPAEKARAPRVDCRLSGLPNLSLSRRAPCPWACDEPMPRKRRGTHAHARRGGGRASSAARYYMVFLDMALTVEWMTDSSSPMTVKTPPMIAHDDVTKR